MSDVHTLGVRSWYHPIDRYFALFISIYHFYSLKSYRSLVINILLFWIGFKFLKRSQKRYDEHDKIFLLEHTIWHTVAPVMALTSDL
jgi:hypothetical protein